MQRVSRNGSFLLVGLGSRPTCRVNKICFSQAHCTLPKQIGALNLGSLIKLGRGGEGEYNE